MHALLRHQVKKERENEKGRRADTVTRTKDGRSRSVNVPQAHATKDVPSLSPMLRDIMKVDIRSKNRTEDSAGGKTGNKVDTMRPHVKVNWPQGERGHRAGVILAELICQLAQSRTRMWKDSIFCSRPKSGSPSVRGRPYTFYAFAYSLEKRTHSRSWNS